MTVTIQDLDRWIREAVDAQRVRLSSNPNHNRWLDMLTPEHLAVVPPPVGRPGWLVQELAREVSGDHRAWIAQLSGQIATRAREHLPSELPASTFATDLNNLVLAARPCLYRAVIRVSMRQWTGEMSNWEICLMQLFIDRPLRLGCGCGWQQEYSLPPNHDCPVCGQMIRGIIGSGLPGSKSQRVGRR
jgi:hypothetical protein